jgi:hypothetical protein
MMQLIDLLNQASAVLQPFTRDVRPGALVYDGTSYSQSSTQSPDAYAIAWWFSFRNTVALLDSLETLTPRQRDYLRHSLCGGMGSFSDFSLDEERWGVSAKTANQKLTQIRGLIYETLIHDDTKVA